MPPKRPTAAKRPRSSSRERGKSGPASRSRSRSPTSPHTGTNCPTSLWANAAPSPPLALRRVEEWKLLHDGSVMALPPTSLLPERAAAAGTSASGGQGGPALAIRVAAFDFDDTLVKYERRKVPAGAADDVWEWRYPSVPGHLKALSTSGYLVAIFSNQSTINGFKGGWNSAKAAAVQSRIIAVGRALEVPLVAYVSTKHDRWRKPLPGLWGQLQEDILAVAPASAAVDCSTGSFYVGDAAGRPAGPGKPKKDFSCGDRRFAHNLGLPFFTDSEFFEALPDSALLCAGGKRSAEFDAAVEVYRRPRAVFDWDGVGPEELRAIPSSYAGLTVQTVTATHDAVPLQLPAQPPFFGPAGGSRQEMVILVGPPSCGKSTLYRRHFQPAGYVHVNRDSLGTKERCLKVAEQMWTTGHSVVVDNTNPTPEDRKLFCDIVKRGTASSASVGATSPLPIRFVELECGKSLALHLNGMRARLGQAAAIPAVAFHTFYSRYKPVSTMEVAATGAECALRLPPVISFEGLPPQTKREFFLLS